MGWFLNSVCSISPVPLQDGNTNIQCDTVVAIKGSHNSIWFARVLTVRRKDLDVQYFDKCKATNTQKYYLMPDNRESTSKDVVICSGVPLQPQVFHRTQTGAVIWKLVLPYSCYQNLSKSDHDMTNYPSKTYSLCKYS